MMGTIWVGAHEPTVLEEPEREDHSCDGCGSDDCTGECFERPPFSLDSRALPTARVRPKQKHVCDGGCVAHGHECATFAAIESESAR